MPSQSFIEKLPEHLRERCRIAAAQDTENEAQEGEFVLYWMCTAQDIQSSSQHMVMVSCNLSVVRNGTRPIIHHPVEMVVDSAASNSVMSASMMRQLGFEPHLSKHVSGHASGIGQSDMVGILERITCQMTDAPQIEFDLFFMVLETTATAKTAPFILLGLDQLRRFQCILDLEDSVLRFGGKQGFGVPLLSRERAAQTTLTKAMKATQAELDREYEEIHLPKKKV